MKRTCAWLVLPLVLGTLSFLLVSGRFRRVWFSLAEKVPVAVFPEEIDLGERNRGELAIGEFEISNQGNAVLVLDQIQSNCSCTGMEREENGAYKAIESLQLSPGERAKLAVRVSVRGAPVGAAMHNYVEFRTNDPLRPTGRIHVLVRRLRGGVIASPSSIVLGPSPVGSEVSTVVDVRDANLAPRQIDRLEITGTSHLSAQLLSRKFASAREAQSTEEVLIGQIKVSVDTSKAGDICGRIEIYLKGDSENPDPVSIAAKILAPIEISPAFLLLPRQSQDGPIYNARCVCRSTQGKPLTINVDSAPEDAKVEVVTNGDVAVRVVRIAFELPNQKLAGEGRKEQIVLRCRAGEEETTLVLPVVLR